MELNEKLQELRKAKGLTQEELAQALYVSRTAISKWESGRGYPSIDSLKAIAQYFGITIDMLLSGDEVLSIAEADSKHKQNHMQDLVFGLLDISTLLFFFLPLFGQEHTGTIQEVSLLALSNLQPWLRISYFAVVAVMILTGLMTLALQNCTNRFWDQYKAKLSFLCNGIAALLFILSRQPYAAALTFVFLVIKVFLLLKKQ